MTTTIQQQPGVNAFLARFAEIEERVSQNGQSWWTPTRKAAIARFEELGFPTTRVEAWKHTNLAPLADIEFGVAPIDIPPGEVRSARGEPGLDETEAFRLVFVNGRFVPDLSISGDLPEGVTIAPMAEAIHAHKDLVKTHLGKVASFDEHPFVALNAALFEDGAFVHVAANAVVEGTIHLLFLTTDSDTPHAAHPRNLIVAERGAQAKILETHTGTSDNVYLNNAVTEIVVGENARVDHCRLQEESENAYHFGTVRVRQEADSRFSSHILSIGAKLNRNDAGIFMDGENIEGALNGLFLLKDKQHVDNHTRLDHAKPHCYSHELFKGILDDSSSGAFTGRIVVHEDAQKTDAVQSSRNLLLSKDASVTPDPQLEIYADDVKCTHGATVGQLDESAIFYLQARGIDKESAKGLLTYAFANELIEKIPFESVRDRLEKLIGERYRKA